MWWWEKKINTYYLLHARHCIYLISFNIHYSLCDRHCYTLVTVKKALRLIQWDEIICPHLNRDHPVFHYSSQLILLTLWKPLEEKHISHFSLELSFKKIFFLFLFLLFRAVPVAYGSSQARGRFGAAAASLHHSHNNVRSEPHLWPIPWLTATLNH